MPYGEEIIALGGRTSADKYVVDDVRQGFTGYENDSETGLDYAQARMYSKNIGRFTGVDPLHSSAFVAVPQTWNRYVYVQNNPLINTDPLGLYTYGTATEEERTINYVYDDNGNLTSKTDARGVKTDYVYDALSRVTNQNYSLTGSPPPNYQASPNVTYFYDGTNIAGGIANSKGKLTKVSSSVSATEYTEFDILGRVKAHKQTTDGTAYTTGYTYNLSGVLIEETYPSGRVVRNTLDNDGSLQQVQSQRVNDTFRNYANGFNYTAAGAVSSMRLGNGKWENTTFNSRLQPTQIGLGGSATNTSLLKLNYDYGTTDNNGNVKSQIINTGTATFTQTYLYDSLNRLTEAKEVDASNQQTWKQNFGYDRFGNRTTFTETILNPDNTTTTNNQTPQIDASNNRFTTASGFVYDLSGNVITDNQGRTFNYDGENKQTSVSGTSGTIGTYLYDGDGKRIKKVVPNGETTIFVYDATGKTVAEYSNVVANQTDAKVSYLTNDYLGSPRITTDANGQVVSRRDFRPFGEEIVRTGYGTDSVRKKFTSYERDSESALDYAKARYGNSVQGRFNSVDPYNIVIEKERGKDDDDKRRILHFYLAQPQIWNKYVYAVNNPLKFSDPDGRRPITAGERADIDKFKQSGYDFSYEKVRQGKWTEAQAEAFRHRVDAAAAAIENAIAAVPTGQQDPTNLRVVLYAINRIGDARYAQNNGPLYYESNGITVTMRVGQNKCMFFVGVAYAQGARTRWNGGTSGGGFPVDYWYRSLEYRMPISNDLADSGKLRNFSLTTNPNLGDAVIGGGTTENGKRAGGHGGIYILSDVVVSANDEQGVRTGSFASDTTPSSGFRYFTYKP